MKLLLAFVLCVLTCQLSVSGFTLQFTGNSEVIKELIEPLTLKCSFQILDDQEMEKSTTQSIYIFHETKGFIATLSKDQPLVTTNLQINSTSVEGELYYNVSKDSYLQITWQNPTSSESGKYFCGAHVQNSKEKSESFGRMLTITVERPTFDDLLKNVVGIKKQTEENRKRLQSNEQRIKSIEENFRSNLIDLNIFKDKLIKFEEGSSNSQTEWMREIYKDMNNQVLKNANTQVFLWQHLNVTNSTLSALTNPLFLASTSYNGTLYLLSNARLINNSLLAQEICELLGGYLVEVNTRNEFDFLRNFLKSVKSPPESVYTGGTDEDHEGYWINRFSQTPMKTFWASHQPDDGSLAQHCQTFWQKYDWYMDDLECVHKPNSDSTVGFMCEIQK